MKQKTRIEKYRELILIILLIGLAIWGGFGGYKLGKDIGYNQGVHETQKMVFEVPRLVSETLVSCTDVFSLYADCAVRLVECKKED